MTPKADARWMALALSLGARGQGRVWPNPAVGCVLVRADRVVGRGLTAPGGRPHAETIALAQAGTAARGATAYVTLEPCAHHGQTPPCAEALIAAGVVRVVTPMTDPDSRVAGQGHEMLQEAGVTVHTGVLAEAAEETHRGFLLRQRQGRPLLTLKLATSFDGRIATATGESQWITGPAARRRVHGLRMAHDAVLVGGGTARADDPMLTVRGLGAAHQPVRVVASRHAGVIPDGNLAQSAGEVPLWLVHGDKPGDVPDETARRWGDLGARLIPCPVGAGGQLDATGLLGALGAAGLTRVFCEGGGALAASLLQADLVDEVVGFTAGVMLGAEGRPALGALGLARLDEAPRFEAAGVEQIGPDIMHRWRRIR